MNKFIFISLLGIASNTMASGQSKEKELDNPEHIARHAHDIDERLEGYRRWLLKEKDQDKQNIILLEISTLSQNQDLFKPVLNLLSELYIEETPISNSKTLDTLIGPLILKYITTSIDPNFIQPEMANTNMGFVATYKRMFNAVISHDPQVACVVARNGYTYLFGHNATPDAEKLLSEAYNLHPSVPEVAALYVQNCCWSLIKRSQYDILLQALETARKLERIEYDPHFYYIKTIALQRKKQYQEALVSAREAYCLDPASLYRKSLATSLMFNGFYDDAIHHYYTVMRMEDFNDGFLELELLQALQAAGRNQEATDLLLNQFTHIAAHLDSIAEDRRNTEKYFQEMRAKNQQPKTPLVANIKSVRNEQTLTSSSSTSDTPDPFSSTVVKSKKMMKDNPIRNEKKKRKGTPDLDKVNAHKMTEKQINNVKNIPINTITAEEILGENSDAYNIFCQFFDHVEGEVKLHSVHIPMEKALNLLKVFGAVKSGKGSHRKATITNESWIVEEQEKPSEVMLILSKKSELIPYQIQMIVNGFLKLGLFPKHLKQTLIQKQLLYSD